MPENNKSGKWDRNELLSIFVSEEDKKGKDIFAMSNFFNIYIEKIRDGITLSEEWNNCLDFEGILGEIATAIKSGFDISNMGVLVADSSHFSQEIIDGLKKKIYSIGQSKEVAGNLRPVILDENGRIVKFFTLKKAGNPTSVLFDVSALCMQRQLRGISLQLEDISKNIQNLTDFVRREGLRTPFLNARDLIKRAENAAKEEQRGYLKKADEYLMQGLNSLYSDVDDNVRKLSKVRYPLGKIKTVDTYLSYINEDMQLIPRYVGLRAYLFNYLGKARDAEDILEEYRYNLQGMREKSIDNKGHSAFEIIHMYYPYDEQNRDFWLRYPGTMLNALDSYSKMLDQKGTDVYYIDTEISENE